METHSFISTTALANIAFGQVSEEAKSFYRNNAGGVIKKQKKFGVGYNECDAVTNLYTGGRHLHQPVRVVMGACKKWGTPALA